MFMSLSQFSIRLILIYTVRVIALYVFLRLWSIWCQSHEWTFLSLQIDWKEALLLILQSLGRCQLPLARQPGHCRKQRRLGVCVLWVRHCPSLISIHHLLGWGCEVDSLSWCVSSVLGFPLILLRTWVSSNYRLVWINSLHLIDIQAYVWPLRQLFIMCRNIFAISRLELVWAFILDVEERSSRRGQREVVLLYLALTSLVLLSRLVVCRNLRQQWVLHLYLQIAGMVAVGMVRNLVLELQLVRVLDILP